MEKQVYTPACDSRWTQRSETEPPNRHCVIDVEEVKPLCRGHTDGMLVLASGRRWHLRCPPRLATTSATARRHSLRPIALFFLGEPRPGSNGILYGRWFPEVVMGSLQVSESSGRTFCCVVGRFPLWTAQELRDLQELCLTEPRLQARQGL